MEPNNFKKRGKFSLKIFTELSSDFLVPILCLFLLLLGLTLVLANLKTSLNIKSKAVSGINPVSWDTQYVKLNASDFFILAGGRQFDAKGIVLSRMTSDPGDRNYTTLEAGWMEDGVEMRLYIYFRADNQNWWAYEIRTYDGRNPGDWKIFTNFAPYFKTPLGQPYVFPQIGLTSDDGLASIYFKNLSLQAFANIVPISTQYQLTPPPGTDINLKMDLLNPGGSYGVSAKLYDANGNFILDQSDYAYEWSSEFPNVASVLPDSTCLPDMLTPCPKVHALIKALEPGSTRVRVDVKKLSINQYIASTYWNVNVSYLLFEGAPNPPSDVQFSVKLNPKAKGTDVYLTWKDNSNNESGFLISWTIQGSDSGTYIKDSAGSLIVPLLTIPCATIEKIYYATAMVIAGNDSGTSYPSYGDLSIKVPSCSVFTNPEYGDPRADINGDGVVNILDYVILFENFGKRVIPLI